MVLLPAARARALAPVFVATGESLASSGIASYVAFWHKDDLHPAAPEGPITNGFWTLGAEGLLSGGKTTVF